MMFQHLQQPNGFTCGITVAAMITGQTFNEAETCLKNIRFLLGTGEGAQIPTGMEISIYLLMHRWYDGLMVGPIRKRDDWAYVTHINSEIPLDSPAMLIVESANKGIIHAILWTGQEVFDPLKKTPSELAEYSIIEWRPLVRIGEITQENLRAEAELLKRESYI